MTRTRNDIKITRRIICREHEESTMSSPYPSPDTEPEESIDDLMLRDEGEESASDRSRTVSSVRDLASRIPESLSAIGRDISRTIERAMSAKDDYVVAVKVSP